MTEKLAKFSIALVLAAAILAAAPVRAEHTRRTNPDALSVELLGRSMLYSVYYDRAMSDDFVAGFGFGQSGTKQLIPGVSAPTANLVPAYVNYYFVRDAGSPYVTAGVSLVLNNSDVNGYSTNSGNLRFNNSTVLPHAGFGYEYRSDANFLFRAAGYAILGDKVIPWGGFSFGYCF